MKTSLADKWFSVFIRLRDTGEDGFCICYTCGKKLLPKEMTVGHYVKRQFSGARFSELNKSQCIYCNYYLQGNDAVYRRKLVEDYGEEKVLLMEAVKHDTRQLKAYQLAEIAKIYELKAKELAKLKGVSLW